MINSFSVASSHSAAGAGAGAAAAITLHFNYNNNSKNNNNKNKSNKSNINNNNNIKIVPAAATIEHKNHNLINSSVATTTKMFKITQSEVVEAKHFLMTYPQQHQQPQQQQQQQQRAGGSLKWISPSKIITSASTKEPQFIQVNIQSSSSSNNNNSNINTKQQLELTATTTTTTAAIAKSAFIEPWTIPQQQQQQKQRTEDQENAFRQIEDVHNYAKLQHQRHHQQQQQLQQLQHSGSSEDDELGEDEEDDEEDEELLNGDLEEEEDYDEEVLMQAQRKLELKNQRKVPNNIHEEDSEEHVEVDVVTVTPTTPTTPSAATTAPQQQQQMEEDEQHATSTIEQDHMRPEHHARRPMNAFLIFCKRHRAIVKERYKSLENRAITKILGDWWAALDEQEKLCFTELAQLNKDAFFNANPNFKWYKLPAPPLRTLATRPSNAAAAHLMEEQQQSQQQQQEQQLLLQHQQQLQWVPNKVARLLPRPYFKFADETQMGELSVLLSANAANVPDKDYALQQALSETTQFLSAHMPNNSSSNNSNKRPVDSASNSSEEEERGSPSKKIKSTRSCKGKIYQELINSGQLAASAKKSKCRLNSGGSGGSAGSGINADANSNTPPISPLAAAAGGAAQLPNELEVSTRATPAANKRSNFEGGEFDLEEKIKELPALSLDAYLQRKRSTKKKKKFSSSKKQRNSNSSSSSSAVAAAAAGAPSTPVAIANATVGSKSTRRSKLDQLLPAVIAVGSQKRKARKESITRRDVSAIEQEVASILPLTINGCYYFNQTRPQPATAAAETGTATATDATCLPQQIVSTSPLSSSSSTLSGCEQTPFDVTSTSDLLILAEVAANRTELSKSN